MFDFGKKTIRLKSILSDLQMEMDEKEIKRKYGLNDQSYQLVIERLSERGLLKKDYEEGPQNPDAPQEHGPPEDPAVWTCPACGRPQQKEYDECPHCGVIVSKLSAMDSQRRPHPGGPDHRPHESEPKRSFRAPIITLAIVAALVAGGVILKKSSFKPLEYLDTGSVSLPSGLRNFTQANFDPEAREVSRQVPVLVTFYADW